MKNTAKFGRRRRSGAEGTVWFLGLLVLAFCLALDLPDFDSLTVVPFALLVYGPADAAQIDAALLAPETPRRPLSPLHLGTTTQTGKPASRLRLGAASHPERAIFRPRAHLRGLAAATAAPSASEPA